MKSPRGSARAAYFSRGISLPPWGSVGERVMLEMHKRERWNKLAEWEASMLTIGRLLGASGAGVLQLITGMKRELDERYTNRFYDARIILAQMYGKRAALQKDINAIERLDAMAAG